MRPEVFKDNNNKEIQPEDLFKRFQLKEYISTALEKFGRYASIAVAVWTIVAMIRSLINYCNGIVLVKRITKSYKKTADYALSPSSYLIRRLEKRNKVDIKNKAQLTKRVQS